MIRNIRVSIKVSFNNNCNNNSKHNLKVYYAFLNTERYVY
jgi:hypothetical protein